MKALILTLGTRGDVQPFAALAHGLAAAGHDAVLAAPHRFAALAARAGAAFAGIDDGPLRLVDDPERSAVGEIARGGLRAKAALALRMPKMFGQVLDDCWAVARGEGAGADVVVHNGQVIAGQHIAERLGKPAVLGLPIPMFVPTREFPWPGQPTPAWLPPALNRATYLGMKGPAAVFGRTVDRWRETTLRLPRRPGRHDPLRAPDGGRAPVLHAISGHVVPRPRDWHPAAHMTGYWFSPPAEAALPPGLSAFLDDGPPPVFIGFGSMIGPDPAATTATVLRAARIAGVRVVLGTGWGGVSAPSSSEVFVVGEAPYEHLFPRVAAVVHHGGAGTIALAAAAGRPQVVCPFVADQHFWGDRAHHLGVAPPPLPQRDLDADRLAAAIREVTAGSGFATAAEELGGEVRQERGVQNAVRLLEELISP